MLRRTQAASSHWSCAEGSNLLWNLLPGCLYSTPGDDCCGDYACKAPSKCCQGGCCVDAVLSESAHDAVTADNAKDSRSPDQLHLRIAAGIRMEPLVMCRGVECPGTCCPDACYMTPGDDCCGDYACKAPAKCCEPDTCCV